MTAEPSRAARWLLPLSRPRDRRVRLVAFAHCGGGPSLFGAWGRHLPPDIEIWAAELPGRERRSGEACERSWAVVIESIAGELADDVPTVLFGHSLGALLAFEVARRLEANERAPQALFVSACAAPQRQEARRRPIHELQDDAFLDAVRAFGGLPEQLIEDREMRTLVMVALRADFALLDAYRYQPAPPLRLPIVAFGGSADAAVPVTDLEDWRQQTAQRFALRLLPGGHFYLRSNPQFFRALARELVY